MKRKNNLNNQTILQLLYSLWSHISPRRHRQFGMLLVLTLLSALMEVVSLSAILPFIGIITQPDKVFAYPLMADVAEMLGILSPDQLVFPLALAFSLAALTAGVLRILLLWANLRLGNATGADLGIDVYKRTLYQPYSVHVARSSSEIISGITQKVGAATSVVISVITVVTTLALFLAIMMTLLVIDPSVAIISSLSFGGVYILIAWSTRKRLKRNSLVIASEQTQVVKSLQEGLGAIRDVLIDGSQEIYCNVYRKAVLKLQRAGAGNTFMSQAPRFLMEAVGMVIIAIFVLVLSNKPGGVAAAIPLLGMLALAAQRLLPLIQQVYGNWSVVAGSRAVLTDVLALLDQPLPELANQAEPESLAFVNAISLQNISFRYGDTTPWVLDEINLTIPKGARVGFVGSTGSGKSTVIDLIMALLEPSNGVLMVDDKIITAENRRAWQRNIAHVPQAIFLADTTISENIAFGIPSDQIDYERVRLAAKRARIDEFVESYPDGYAAIVGERGVRLSGGQRQRIGIARALYKQASVLVFDEATSALDTETEFSVMQAIDDLADDLTIIMIAHRTTTLKKCDVIFKLDQGQVFAQHSYNEVIQDQT
jgi:ABC-type multidrug transport system fused ATPase/permease subunit